MVHLRIISRAHHVVFFKDLLFFHFNFLIVLFLILVSGVNAERPCPEKRLERINAIRSQLYTCLEDKCGKEFKEKKDFAMHSQIAHSLILKAIIPRPTYKQIHNFTLSTTPLTRAARFVFESSLPARKNYFKKLARQAPLSKTADFALIKKTCKLEFDLRS